MSQYLIDANDMDFDELTAKMKADTIIQCPGCHAYLIWDKLPDDSVQTYREHHGEPNMQPEIIVTGYVCPECGDKIDF